MNDMMSILLTFLLCSYSIGWANIGRKAIKYGVIDLCDLVRTFMFSPFITAVATPFLSLGMAFTYLLILNIWIAIKVVLTVVVGIVIFGLIGNYAVMPAVKKSYGIVKPFSSKICVVLYRKK